MTTVISDNNFKVLPPLIKPSPYVIAEHHLLSNNVVEDEYDMYNAGTVYNAGDRVIVSSSSSSVTITGGVSGTVTWNAHSLPNKTCINFTGALPLQLSASKVYYTKEATSNTFKVSETPGGTAIPIDSASVTAEATRHDVYEATDTTTAGEHPAVVVSKWIRVSASNAWKMFDTSSGSQTTNQNEINFTVRAIGRTNLVSLIGVEAETIQVIITDSVDGVIYDKTKSGLNTSGIITPSAWFFDPIDFKEEVDFADIPELYSNLDIQVVLKKSNGTVRCGICVIGLVFIPGKTQTGISMAIEDYSVKTTDEFGNTTVQERGFAKEVDLKALVANTKIDKMQRILSDLRATPSVYIGTSDYGSSVVLGYYERFSTLVRYPTYSILTIQLRGIV